MKNFLYLTILLSFLISTGCNKTGVPVEFAKVCDKANDEEIVEVEGFIDDGGSVFCSKGKRPLECGFQVKQNLEDEKYFKADIEAGTWSNNVEKLKSGYKKEDIKMWDDNGELIDLSKKLKVTGRVHVFDGIDAKEGVDGCYMTVTKLVQ